MVVIEEIMETEPTPPTPPTPMEVLPSQERLLDAQAIETAAASMTRPSAKMHMEALAKKLRKESEALKRVEANRAKQEETGVKDVEMPEQPPASKPPAAPAVPPSMPGAKYVPIDRFSFDAGGYNAPNVTLYVPLPSVGSIPRENVTCDFTPSSFDLIVKDLNGKSYRLFKDNLEKDIDPEKCKYLVKADKVVLKLAKVKGEYGSYDFWTELTAKKKKRTNQQKNPQESIMDLMKDMYESGDDNMKKMIGETMMKQRRGELDDPMAGGGLGQDF